MVLPFMLIGKALLPLSKIKKQGWKAMGQAFGSMRASVNPMKSFGKIMEIMNVVMLPLTYLFTLLAGIILTKLMPYIAALILLIDEWEDEMDWAVNSLEKWLLAFYSWMKDMRRGWNGFWDDLEVIIVDWYNDLLIASENWSEDMWKMWRGFWTDLADAIWGWAQDIIDMFTGGGGGGGGGDSRDPHWSDIFSGGLFHSGGVVPRTGWYKLQAQERLIDKHSTRQREGININIDMRGSIIDNRDKLIMDIAEQVTMRIW